MRQPFHLALVLALALVTTSACAASGDGPTTSPAPASPTPTPPSATAGATSTASASPSGIDATLPDDLRTRPAVAAAIADTATRAKVDPSQVVIAAWSPVTWTDGSLGCPKKGMGYTQALVDGELLLLRTETALYQYNAPATGPFVYCASPSANYTVGG